MRWVISYGSPVTKREKEVLQLLAEGLTNKEIGARLFISPKTVEVHLSHIHERTGISSRVGIAVWWVRQEVPA